MTTPPLKWEKLSEKMDDKDKILILVRLLETTVEDIAYYKNKTNKLEFDLKCTQESSNEFETLMCQLHEDLRGKVKEIREKDIEITEKDKEIREFSRLSSIDEKLNDQVTLLCKENAKLRKEKFDLEQQQHLQSNDGKPKSIFRPYTKK